MRVLRARRTALLSQAVASEKPAAAVRDAIRIRIRNHDSVRRDNASAFSISVLIDVGVRLSSRSCRSGGRRRGACGANRVGGAAAGGRAKRLEVARASPRVGVHESIEHTHRSNWSVECHNAGDDCDEARAPMIRREELHFARRFGQLVSCK